MALEGGEFNSRARFTRLQPASRQQAAPYTRLAIRPKPVPQLWRGPGDGDFFAGIFWLIITPGLWIGTGGLFGWVCQVIAAATAHHRARVKNRALA